jgi:hypothetical protein
MGTGGGGNQNYPPVDPGGLQTASTGASALGFVALVGSGAGTTVASALGLGAHTPQVLGAGISMASLGSLNLFSAGLILVGLGIVLNIASLVLRRQYSQEGPPYSRGDSSQTNTTEKPGRNY